MRVVVGLRSACRAHPYFYPYNSRLLVGFDGPACSADVRVPLVRTAVSYTFDELLARAEWIVDIAAAEEDDQ